MRRRRPLRDGLTRRAWQAALLWTVFGLLAWAVVSFVSAPDAGAQALDHGVKEPMHDGAALWARDCASCHGPKGNGTRWGPSLQDAGASGVDVMVSTGRMPIADLTPLEKAPFHPNMQVPRGAGGGPPYKPGQIAALVDYARTILRGPDVPIVDVSGANISHGQELFENNCAACHSWNARGGALANGHAASPLDHTTPTEVVEAMRLGIGTMPRYSDRSISDEGAADIAAYVRYLHHPQNAGGFPLAYLGPVGEGFAAWLVGIVGIVLFVRWIGKRT